MHVSKYFLCISFFFVSSFVQAKVIYKDEVVYYNNYGSVLSTKEYFYTSLLSRLLVMHEIDAFLQTADINSVQEMSEAIQDYIDLAEFNVYSCSVSKLLSDLHAILSKRIYYTGMQLEHNYSYDRESLISASKYVAAAAGFSLLTYWFYEKYTKSTSQKLQNYIQELAKEGIVVEKKTEVTCVKHNQTKPVYYTLYDSSSSFAKLDVYVNLDQKLNNQQGWNIVLGIPAVISYALSVAKVYDAWKKDPNRYNEALATYQELLGFVEQLQEIHTA